MSGVTAMSQNRSCGSYGPGHLMHWIQGKKSHEDGQPVIKVKVVAVHDDGRVEIEGDECTPPPRTSTGCGRCSRTG
jgi:hypothetical protein